MRVTAVVTWFRPDAGALLVLDDALRECDDVVVVDNTPRGEPTLEAPDPRVRLLRPGRNLGLAGALNLSLAHAPGSALLLLDQDSRLPIGLVERLLVHLAAVDVGAAGPAPWDAEEKRYLDPRTARRPTVAELPVLITSGLLVRREALAEVGPFREDFFVDAVDLDLCLRLRRAGYRLLQDRSLRLPHRLGATRWHRVLGVGVRATHHPDWRVASAARNGGVLVREHLRTDPRWAVTHLLLMTYWALTVAAFEPPRRRRLLLLLRGFSDGLRRRPWVAGPPGA